MVQPLRKEATVERDSSAVVCGNVLQTLCQRGGQSARCVHGCRWEGGRDLGDELGGRLWGSDLPLQVSKEGLALIGAADRIVLRGSDTVRWRVDVVRDYHARPLGLGLVQGPQLPEVLHRLAELPASLQRASIE